MESQIAKALPKEIKTVQDFAAVMSIYESQVAQLLGNKYGMTSQEFCICTINAIKKTPKLLECNMRSVFGAIMLSAELGLKPNTPDGLAYILPYKKEAQFQIGYKGLIEIALRSPMLQAINGYVVYENEFFNENQDGTITHIKFNGMDLNKKQLCFERTKFLKEIGISADDAAKDIKEYVAKLAKGKGDLVLVYAAAYIDGKDIPVYCTVTKDVLDKIQNLSQSKNSEYSPYNSGVDVHNTMQMKAAIKKLYKVLPKTGNPLMAKAIEVDDLAIMGSVPIIQEDGTVQMLDTKGAAKEEQLKKIEESTK